jgi:hypothetical protein
MVALDGALLLYDIPGGHLIAQYRANNAKLWYGVSWSPDGRRLAATSEDEALLYIVDVP